MNLNECHYAFRSWLGESYDLGALDAVLATAAVNQLDGDPVWLLMVAGAGGGKTETVSSLAGAGAHVESTIASEAALLSGTPQKERTQSATGGLLRKIGSNGILVLKDFTTIISANRDTRAAVLAALREIYDGHWTRNVGTDGGRTITWNGRLVLIGATTSAYDKAHGVVSAMGDRFALIRTDTAGPARRATGRQALSNVGSEIRMRADLQAAAGSILTSLDRSLAVLTDEQYEQLLLAADLVTLARTSVERDYQGNVLDSHMPEAPTRFAKMLAQIMRGCFAIGCGPDHSLATALRVARDSMPPLRLSILRHLSVHPALIAADIVKAMQKPKVTIHRELDALHLLGLVTYDETPYTKWNGDTGMHWVYSLAKDVDVSVVELGSVPGMSVQAGNESKNAPDVPPPSDKPGTKTSAQTWITQCEKCGWDKDSQGHKVNCEGVAA